MQVIPDETCHVASDGHASNDVFVMPDDLEGCLLAEDPYFKSFKEPPALIAVMGVTGSGKTTFVNQASGSNLKVGNDLDSCTSAIQESEECVLDGRRVILVDTPGFGDACKSDTDVLKSIAAFLGESYFAGVKLAGVIYVRKISDNKFGTLAAKNFKMFRRLCGEKTLKNVVLMTNMWGKVTLQEGAGRELELGQKHFKTAIEKGARLCRHYNTPESARAILRTILENQPMVLKIQRELIDEGKDIEQTGAGEELSKEIRQAVVAYKAEIEHLEEGMRMADDDDDEGARDELESDKRRQEEEAWELQECLEGVEFEFVLARREIKERINAKFEERLRRMKEEHEAEIRKYEDKVKELEQGGQGHISKIAALKRIIEELRGASRYWKCLIM